MSSHIRASNPAAHPLRPRRYRFSSYDMADVERALAVLRGVARGRRMKSVASVGAQLGLRAKGGLRLIGIQNEQQARDAVAALGRRLMDEEVAEIDRVSFPRRQDGAVAARFTTSWILWHVFLLLLCIRLYCQCSTFVPPPARWPWEIDMAGSLMWSFSKGIVDSPSDHDNSAVPARKIRC